MSGKSYKLTKFVEEFELEVLHKGDNYDTVEITVPDLNRPGLQFVGFYDHYEDIRLQIIGKVEHLFLSSLDEEERNMIHPSYVELMKVVNQDAEVGEEPVVNSRYSIVIATAKRARQIVAGSEPMIRVTKNQKPLSTAVEELFTGMIHILPEEEGVDEEAVI